MPLTPELFPVSLGAPVSADTNVLTNAATLVVGGAAPVPHGFLVFATTALPVANRTFGATLTIQSSASAGAAPALVLWASQLATGPNAYLYNRVLRNSNPLRIRLGQVLASAASPNAVGSLVIPSRFINRGADSLFELRPQAGYVPLVGNTRTIEGATSAVTPTADFVAGVVVNRIAPAANPANARPVVSVLHYTAAEIENLPDPAIVAIGSEGYLAFEQETWCGSPVRGMTLLDLLSSDLDSAAENLPSGAIRRERSAPTKMAVGRAGAGGGFSFEATPERCWKLLQGMFRRTSSVGPFTSNGVSGCYLHEFRVAQTQDIQFFTFVQKSADRARYVYPGAIIDSIGITAGLDSLVDVACSVLARDEFTYDRSASGSPDGITDAFLLAPAASYDANEPLSFVGGEITVGDAGTWRTGTVGVNTSTLTLTNVTVAGAAVTANEFVGRQVRVVSTSAGAEAAVQQVRRIVSHTAGATISITLENDLPVAPGSGSVLSIEPAQIADRGIIQQVSITFSNAAGECRGIRRNRGTKGHFPGKLTASVSFSMYFETFDMFRKYLGNSSSDFPFNAERALQFDRMELKFAGPRGEGIQELVIDLPRMMYTVVRKGVGGEGPVMLEATAMATFDPNVNSNVRIFLRNQEPPAAFESSTDYITVVPSNYVFPNVVATSVV